MNEIEKSIRKLPDRETFDVLMQYYVKEVHWQAEPPAAFGLCVPPTDQTHTQDGAGDLSALASGPIRAMVEPGATMHSFPRGVRRALPTSMFLRITVPSFALAYHRSNSRHALGRRAPRMRQCR